MRKRDVEVADLPPDSITAPLPKRQARRGTDARGSRLSDSTASRFGLPGAALDTRRQPYDCTASFLLPPWPKTFREKAALA